MFDFNKTLKENAHGRVLLCAHRGVSSANIPCNTLAAFKAALMQGADIIELDVSKSRDGKYFVFHPGMESAHLRKRKSLSLMSAKKIENLRFVNQDDCKTFLGINTLEEIFDFLRGKCYINVDKFWTDIPGITECIRRCGVEKQVIVKTPVKDRYIEQIKKYAPDFMFIPMIKNEDTVSEKLLASGINYVGAEVLFADESAPVASSEYIEKMHSLGLMLYVNAIVYNSRDVLSAGHSDDNAIIKSPDFGWGWLIDRGFDIIQTDWCGMLKNYMENRK